MAEFERFRPEVQKWFTGLEADDSKERFGARRNFFEGPDPRRIDALLTELSTR